MSDLDKSCGDPYITISLHWGMQNAVTSGWPPQHRNAYIEGLQTVQLRVV